MRCDAANNVYALPANAGSAQPIAHCGVLPVEVNKRCDVAWPPGLGKRAETFPKKGSIPSHGANFNADRLIAALCGLKHETDSGNQIGAQELAALTGGRRHFQRSGIRDQTGVLETLPRASNTDAACFKGMGSFRLASQTGEPYTTRPAAPFPAEI